MKLALAALLLLVSTSSHADSVEAKARFDKGTSLYAVERWDEAIAEFEAGFIAQPLPSFLFNIAQAHKQAGRREKAVKYYQKYLDLDPNASDRAEVEKLIAEQSAPPPAPMVVAQVVAPPPAPSPPPRPPIYRRWWFWTAIVAVVVVGAAVAIGLEVASQVPSDFGTVHFP